MAAECVGGEEEVAGKKELRKVFRIEQGDDLSGISLDTREALILAARKVKYKHIAEALGVPVGTVRSRLSRARARIAARRVCATT